MSLSRKFRDCSRCSRDQHEVKLFSAANNTHPGPIPAELLDLTQVEEMLISPILPMTVYRLPHGQLGYSGHVINLPQNVSSFVSSLPRTLPNMEILVVRKPTCDGNHKDFRVQRQKILHALKWLKANNPYFHKITIDYAVLEELPNDSILPNIPTISESLDSPEDKTSSQPESDEQLESSDKSSFVPSVVQSHSREEDTIQKQLSHGNPVSWPMLDNTPINEFQTEGYFSLAFPTLFPDAKGDFTVPRVRTITIGYFFKHLMLYSDGRFAKHPRFRYFALNTEMRWRAMQSGRIYISEHQ